MEATFKNLGQRIGDSITHFINDFRVAFSCDVNLEENEHSPIDLQFAFHELRCINPKEAQSLLECFHSNAGIAYQQGQDFLPSSFPKSFHKGFHDRIEMVIRGQRGLAHN